MKAGPGVVNVSKARRLAEEDTETAALAKRAEAANVQNATESKMFHQITSKPTEIMPRLGRISSQCLLPSHLSQSGDWEEKCKYCHN